MHRQRGNAAEPGSGTLDPVLLAAAQQYVASALTDNFDLDGCRHGIVAAGGKAWHAQQRDRGCHGDSAATQRLPHAFHERTSSASSCSRLLPFVSGNSRMTIR